MENELRRLYEQRWPVASERLSRMPDTKDLSYPFLLDPAAHNYSLAQCRLMVVGQQTNGWVGNCPLRDDVSEIEQALAVYASFALGTHYRATPFWVDSHRLYRTLNPSSPENGFLWNNLLKLDRAGGRPGDGVWQILLSSFNVLAEEVRITAPHVVVFLTGPYYDVYLQRALPGAQLKPLTPYPGRQLAQVVHPSLPEHSYRTYHPRYLRMSGKEEFVDVICRHATS